MGKSIGEEGSREVSYTEPEFGTAKGDLTASGGLAEKADKNVR